MNQTTEYQEYPKGNREHKSSLFCKVFDDKKHLLDLYNCVNKTNYQNADDLEVNTLKKCRRLEEYSIFVARVRQYATADIEHRESAISRAIDECIAEGILVDILIEQKAEVLELMLTTFNRELYEQGLKEEGAREADERIADLEQENENLHNQLLEADNKLREERQRIVELEAKLAQHTNK